MKESKITSISKAKRKKISVFSNFSIKTAELELKLMIVLLYFSIQLDDFSNLRFVKKLILLTHVIDLKISPHY